MNANTAALKLSAAVNVACAINTRWVYIDDGACEYYLDCRGLDGSDFSLMDEDDGYSHFCAATKAVHFDELPASSKRAAVAELGEQARKTGGW